MKEVPILCTADEVRAIFAGRKTQLRRPLKQQPPQGCRFWEYDNWRGLYARFKEQEGQDHAMWTVRCPHGQSGSTLWVRETWSVDHANGIPFYIYKAKREVAYRWRPSSNMPREACRLLLTVKNVRVEHRRDDPWVWVIEFKILVENPLPGQELSLVEKATVEFERAETVAQALKRLSKTRPPSFTKADLIFLAKRIHGVDDASVEEHASTGQITLTVIYRSRLISHGVLKQAMAEVFRHNVPINLSVNTQLIEAERDET